MCVCVYVYIWRNEGDFEGDLKNDLNNLFLFDFFLNIVVDF